MNRSTWMVAAVLVLASACGDDAGDTDTNQNQNDNLNAGSCGNGVLEPPELCDDGAENSDTEPDRCRTTCIPAGCGDGVADSDEECDGNDLKQTICSDSGFTHGELGCHADCIFDHSGCATCGNGVAEGDAPEAANYELCDGDDLRDQTCLSIGQADGDLACNDQCQWDINGCDGGSLCGDGIVEGNETCDDSNTTPCDGCSATCKIEECGNGVVECNETCDDANGDDTDSCPASCLDAVCGDGYHWAGVEECDDGVGNSDTTPDACRTDCTLPACGDGIKDATEECDGNDLGGETCLALGYIDGTLSCRSDCQFQQSNCVCRLLDSSGCPTGTACYLLDGSNTETVCQWPGSAGQGQSCGSHASCLPQHLCLDWECRRICTYPMSDNCGFDICAYWPMALIVQEGVQLEFCL